MARQVLPIAGAVIGGFLGGPTGAQIGFTIGSIVGNAVDPQTIQGPKIGEAGLQTSAEGVFRPIVYGTGAVKGNVIERGNRQVVTQRNQQGKGGGPVVEEQRVYWTFAIRVAEGPIGGISRIWQDEKLVYDITVGSTIPAESSEFADGMRVYLGDESQLPDPDLEAYKGVGNVNAYRGTAYIVFPNFDLTDRRESIPDFRFEVTNATSTQYNYLSLMHMNTANPLVDQIPTNTWTGGQFDNTTFKFGPGSRYIELGGVGEGVGRPMYTNTDFATIIGTQDFCFSGWVMRETAPDKDADTIMGHWYQPGTRSLAWQIWRPGGGDTMFVRLSADGTDFIEIASDDFFPYDQWVYVALTRESGTVRMFQDGVMVASGSFPYALHSNAGMVPGENWSIGGFDQINIETAFRGWMDEFVMILGDPVYTSNFTPPTQPWPDPSQSGSEPILLSSIVADLHDRVQQEPLLYDVSELTDLVQGLVLSGEYTAADSVRTLMPMYFFDSSEFDDGSGYRIHYPKRGKPVVTTLTVDDLIEAPERSIREDPLERPKVLHLHYQNPTIGYAPAKATTRRNSPDVMVIGERAIQVPVSFIDVDEPAQISDKLMKIAWVEVGGEELFTIHDGHLGLVPSDCVGVSLRGQVRRMRIVREEIIGGRIRLVLLPDRQSAYTSNITGVPVPEPTPPLPSIVGQTIHEFMDLPALNDGNDRLLWYEAATGQTEAWYGAQTQRKIPPATEFENSARFTTHTIMGILDYPIYDASEHYPDTTNVVTVQLYTDDMIESLTEQQFLSEGGSFALENPDGTWEVMQYRDAEQNSSGSWELSHLARGRLNSGTSSHDIGDRFVLLDGVQSVDAITAWIGANVTTRAVSFGTSPETALQSTDPYIGKSQIEFPVAHLFLSLDGDTLTANTVPRHRFGTEDNPVRSINWTGYRWSATDGANTINVDGLSDTQTFDVTGWGSPITVTVSQLNRFTGPGPSVSEIV